MFLAFSNQKLQGRALTRFRSKGSPPIRSNMWSNCAVLFFRQTGKRRKRFDEIKNFLCKKNHLHNFLCKLQQTEVDFACSQRVKEYRKVTTQLDLPRNSSSNFRETDNFRLYRLLSRDQGRNRKIGPVKALDNSFSYMLQKTVWWYLVKRRRNVFPENK